MKNLLIVCGLIFTTTVYSQVLYLPGTTSGIGNNPNNGNVGIGTNNPIYGRLQINQASDGPDYGIGLFNSTGQRAMRIWVDANASYVYSNGSGTSPLVLNSGGNVGIGTTTPNNILSVKGRMGIRADGNPSAVNETLRVEGAIGVEENVVNVTNLSDQDFIVRLSAVSAATKRTIIGPSVSTRFSLGVGVTNNNEHLTIISGGNVGIGTTNPNKKLTVNGTIYGKEVQVDLSVPGPDYVFEKDYALPSLEEVKLYIEENKHLPEVPSAKDMEANGINVGEMNMILLKKVEELTLYVIELKKEVENLKDLNSMTEKNK